MREYTNGEITVLWDKAKCIHSANCLRGLPSVFDVRKRTWIDMQGASSEEIIATVHTCPSGALSIKEEIMSSTNTDAKITIRVTDHGPYLVDGSCTIERADGTREEKEGKFALCRCGGSQNKPFCDGSHKKIGF